MLQSHLFFYHDHWSTFEHENQTSREKKKIEPKSHVFDKEACR